MGALTALVEHSNHRMCWERAPWPWKGELCFPALVELSESAELLEKDISTVPGFQERVLAVSCAKVCQRNGTVAVGREWFSYG